MARTREQLLEHHLEAFASGDRQELMRDYADDAVMLTLDGAYTGKEAIADFFESVAETFPNLELTVTGRNARGDVMLVVWRGNSDVATVEYGVDTFVIHDDEIHFQTIWFSPPVPNEKVERARGSVRG